MKRLKSIYSLAALLIVVTFGMYACSSNQAKEASIFSIPNFSSSTNIKPAKKKPVSTLQDLNDALVDIAKQVNPTVVAITTKEKVKIHRAPNPFGFFNFFGRPSQRQSQPETRLRQGLGSGVIVSPDGYILTNNHVISGADHITVKLGNNKTYVGDVVGADPLTDLAVVKIDAHNLPTIELGNSDSLKVGSLVMAIGNPENLYHTVTFGIVSAKHRHIGLLHSHNILGFANYIQTDAAINPGNSGGAMVNMSGQLVGINAAIFSKNGTNSGIGFAVPINLAKRIMKQIIKNGKVVHAQLGIAGSNINEAMAKSFGLKNNIGIIINHVVNDTPADHAGLQKGDIIKTVNGEPIESYKTFRTKIATSQPGRKITLGIIRDGNHKNIQVTLGKLDLKSEKSSPNSNQDIRDQLGFEVTKLTGRVRQQLDLSSSQQGVVVTDVSRGSKALRNGLRKGDVITHINREKIEGMSDFNDAIDALQGKGHPTVLLQVINRNGYNQYIAFTL